MQLYSQISSETFAVLGSWGNEDGELVYMASKHIPIYFPNFSEDLVFNLLPSLGIFKIEAAKIHGLLSVQCMHL